MANFSKFLSLITGSDRTVDLSLASNVLELGSGGLQFDSTTSGQHLVLSGSAITSGYSLFWPVAQAASSGLVLTNDGTGHLSWTSPSSGSVTSVAFADASTTPIYSISGSPVTSSGTLTQTLTTQSANTGFFGPISGGVAQPAFRAMVLADVPSLSSLYLPLTGGTMTGAINLGGFAPTNSTTPVNPNDLVNKAYVDSAVFNGTSWKAAVVCATTANITTTGEQTIDGVTTSNSRVLVKNQSSPAGNGIYISNSSLWTRASDFQTWAQVPGAAVFVESGTVNADIGFVCISQPGGTFGVTAINFTQFSSAGAYSADNSTLQLSSGVFSVKPGGIVLADLANLPANTIIGNNTGSSATPLALTATQVTAMLNLFSSSLQGLVPASGGGTTNFLRADGTWSVAGTGTVTSIAFSVPGSSIFGVTGSPVTTSGTLGLTTTGISGGIPYFSSTSVISSSGLLTANQIVLGGGAGAAPTSLAAAANVNQVLHGNPSGAPTYSAVVVADMNSGAATPGQVLTATGSGGQAYQPPNNPLVPSFIAGQTFTANTTYVVRLGKNSNAETTGSVYAADITTSSADNFWAIGLALSTTGVTSGGALPVALGGVYILGSADTAFNTTDVGKALYLGATGTFTTTPPSAAGSACFRIGTVYNTITILIDKQLIGIN